MELRPGDGDGKEPASIERMTRSRSDFRMRDPEIFLPLPLLACAHCHARILRTIAVDHEIFFVKESRLAPQAVSTTVL